jgi:hypothetical protein
MKKSALFAAALFLTLSLTFTLVALIPVHAQAKKVVGLDLTYREEKGQKVYRVKDVYLKGFEMLLPELEGNLTAGGYQVKEINGFTSANLQGVDALVLSKILDQSFNYTSDEISAIVSWFNTGGKFLVIGSDSDFVESYMTVSTGGFKADQPNKVLAAIGSALRIEYGSVEDSASNAGAAYRVVADASKGGANSEGAAGTITNTAPRMMFHGPTIVVGFKDGKFVPFDQVQDDDNVFWLYRTTESGAIVHSVAYSLQTVSAGQKGRFVLAAAQRINVAGPLGGQYSKVLAQGESWMGDRATITNLYSGVTLFGPTYILNALAWGTTVEQVPTPMTVYAIIAAIVVIVVVVGAVMLRRGRKKKA